MLDYSTTAGQVLRRLRKQRNLTLTQAARQLGTSTPVLSRKERGQDEIKRIDIRAAITVYQLSPWEAYELWIASGFIPEPTLPVARNYDLYELAETLLPHIPFPAFIMNVPGYILAWNQEIEAIWSLSLSENKQVHIIDELFSERIRQLLGIRWEQYVSQALKVFYNKTFRIANDPTLRHLLDHLCRRHGETFIRKWNEAQSAYAVDAKLSPLDMGATVVMHDSPYGMIDYLVMHMTFQFPQEYEVTMYVPFGAQNQKRYQRFKATMGPGRLYMQKTADQIHRNNRKVDQNKHVSQLTCTSLT